MFFHKKILIVEDDMLIALELKQYLVEIGYTFIDILSSPEETFSYIKEQQPDLVLLDIILQNDRFDGIDIGNRMHRLGIPFIYLTSSHDHKTLVRARKSRYSAFIQKPFFPDYVRTLMERAFEKTTN